MGQYSSSKLFWDPLNTLEHHQELYSAFWADLLSITLREKKKGHIFAKESNKGIFTEESNKGIFTEENNKGNFTEQKERNFPWRK